MHHRICELYKLMQRPEAVAHEHSDGATKGLIVYKIR